MEGDKPRFQEIDITSAIEECIGHDNGTIYLAQLPNHSIEPISDLYDPFDHLKKMGERLKAANGMPSSPDKISAWYHNKLDDIEIEEAVFKECLEDARHSSTITLADYMRAHDVLASTANPFYQARQEALDAYTKNK